MQVTSDLRNAMLQGVLNFLASGVENGAAALYEDTTLLATIALQEPFGTIADGVLTVTATPEVMIAVTGMANRCVFKNGEGVTGWESTVSAMGGDGEIQLPATMLYAGGYTRIVSGTIS